MSFWRGFIRGFRKGLVEKSVKVEADLTDDERFFITKHKRCPDCRLGELLVGPMGGCAMNVKCENPDCRHEFNLLMADRVCARGNRINRDDPQIAKMYAHRGSLSKYG